MRLRLLTDTVAVPCLAALLVLGVYGCGGTDGGADLPDNSALFTDDELGEIIYAALFDSETGTIGENYRDGILPVTRCRRPMPIVSPFFPTCANFATFEAAEPFLGTDSCADGGSVSVTVTPQFDSQNGAMLTGDPDAIPPGEVGKVNVVIDHNFAACRRDSGSADPFAGDREVTGTVTYEAESEWIGPSADQQRRSAARGSLFGVLNVTWLNPDVAAALGNTCELVISDRRSLGQTGPTGARTTVFQSVGSSVWDGGASPTTGSPRVVGNVDCGGKLFNCRRNPTTCFPDRTPPPV